MPDNYHRRSIRLKGYDYSRQGAYFVTIVTWNRLCLFGEVVDEKMVLNDLGLIVQGEWFRSADVRREIELHPDELVVMPNHLHGIVWIVGEGDKSAADVGATGRSPLREHPPRGPVPRSLGSFMAGFKSAATKRVNTMRGAPGAPVWQRNYYEHIIRDERSLNRIREYIAHNPLGWALDRENPANCAAGLRNMHHKDEPWRV